MCSLDHLTHSFVIYFPIHPLCRNPPTHSLSSYLPTIIHSPTYLPTCPSIHPCSYPCIHPCIYTSIYPCIYASIHPYSYLCIHPCIYASIQPTAHPLNYPSMHSLIYPSPTHIPFTHSLHTHLPIHPFISPPTYTICLPIHPTNHR